MSEYTIEINKENWKILGENYSINQYDYKAYYKIWSQTFKEQLIQNGAPVLLINDADQIFYNSISIPTISTIVDKDAYLFTESRFKKYLHTTPFTNIQDSLGYSRKLTLLDMSFDEALEDGCFKQKYDLIFINAKDESELSLLNVEKYFLLLNDFGFLCIQAEEPIFKQSVAIRLNHYFSILSDKVRTSNASGSLCYFLTYRKITNLI